MQQDFFHFCGKVLIVTAITIRVMMMCTDVLIP